MGRDNPYRTIETLPETWEVQLTQLAGSGQVTAAAAKWAREVISSFEAAHDGCHRKLCTELASNVELINEAERLRGALEAVAGFLMPEVTRGPAVRSWVNAAKMYIEVMPSGEHAEDVRWLCSVSDRADAEKGSPKGLGQTPSGDGSREK